MWWPRPGLYSSSWRTSGLYTSSIMSWKRGWWASVMKSITAQRWHTTMSWVWSKVWEVANFKQFAMIWSSQTMCVLVLTCCSRMCWIERCRYSRWQCTWHNTFHSLNYILLKVGVTRMKKKQSGIYMNDMKGNSLLMFTFQQNGIHLDFS